VKLKKDGDFHFKHMHNLRKKLPNQIDHKINAIVVIKIHFLGSLFYVSAKKKNNDRTAVIIARRAHRSYVVCQDMHTGHLLFFGRTTIHRKRDKE
jgi:hypothetical protein